MEEFLSQDVRKKAVESGASLFEEKCGLKGKGLTIQI
jgi:hypothetical protein